MKDILINKYRKQLMGVGTIGVLLVHSNGIVAWPQAIEFLFGCGGMGVYMFVFLSAVGLFLSYEQKGCKKKVFYLHRAIRVLIPYLLIAGIWYGLKYIVFEHNMVDFLYEISLLSFWLGHRGAWYVAMLIPVYLIFPWYYDWAESGNRNKKIFGCLTILIMLSFALDFFSPALYRHISQVLCSYIVYLIGYYEAQKITKNQFKGFNLSVLCAGLCIIRTITPLKNIASISGITWAMFGITILIVAAWLLDKINCKHINAFLGFLGKYSLEMYLCNIFLLQVIQYFKITDLFQSSGKLSGYIVYGIVLGFGTILSVIFGKLVRIIVKYCFSMIIDRERI